MPSWLIWVIVAIVVIARHRGSSWPRPARRSRSATAPAPASSASRRPRRRPGCSSARRTPGRPRPRPPRPAPRPTASRPRPSGSQAEAQDRRRAAAERHRGEHDEHLRQADELDPDVDTSSDDYAGPDGDLRPRSRTRQFGATDTPAGDTAGTESGRRRARHAARTARPSGRRTAAHQAARRRRHATGGLTGPATRRHTSRAPPAEAGRPCCPTGWRSEVEAGLAVAEPLGGDRVDVTLAHQHVGLAR